MTSASHKILDPSLGKQVAAGRCALGIMTKAPRAGRVKTRLCPPLTPEEAAALNICFLRDTAAAISQANAGSASHGVGIYTPVGEESAYAGILPDEFFLLPQRGVDFGERLINATADLFRVGYEAVCLIDSDSPTVPAETFALSARLLLQPGERIVLGPSDDGGYYLIGLRQPQRRLFEEIEWSTPQVLNQTVRRAADLGLPVELLPACFDVDDHATLRRLCEELLPAGRESIAPETRRFLAELVRGDGRGRIWPND